MEPSQVAATLSLAGLVLAMGMQTAVNLWPSHVEPIPSPALPNQLSTTHFEDAIPLAAGVPERLGSADASARSEAVQEVVLEIEAHWPDDHRRAFLVALAPQAVESAIEHCVPPSVTLGQAILESGWGRSGLAEHHNNLFGVKAWGKNGVRMKTEEVERGKRHTKRARFQTYEDWSASIAHHDALLSADPRYAEAMERWEHWPIFLETVAPTYASDPKYVARVSELVNTYELDRFDAVVTEVARRKSSCAR
jgi:lysozyme